MYQQEGFQSFECISSRKRDAQGLSTASAEHDWQVGRRFTKVLLACADVSIEGESGDCKVERGDERRKPGSKSQSASTPATVHRGVNQVRPHHTRYRAPSRICNSHKQLCSQTADFLARAVSAPKQLLRTLRHPPEESESTAVGACKSPCSVETSLRPGTLARTKHFPNLAGDPRTFP